MFVYVAVHNEYIVNVYDHVSAHLGRKNLVQGLCEIRARVNVPHIESSELKVFILGREGCAWLTGLVKAYSIVPCSQTSTLKMEGFSSEIWSKMSSRLGKAQKTALFSHSQP